MEDRGQDHGLERNEPVRSRWTPKPEQIVILESIFNSGMVNPPKDETVRIRKLLEPYGSVGDANVFYWFQNRRSRSRRRQRQIQASLAGDRGAQAHAGGAIHYQSNLMPPSAFVPSSSSCLVGSSSSCGGMNDDGVDNLFSFSRSSGSPGNGAQLWCNINLVPFKHLQFALPIWMCYGVHQWGSN
ncbi:WUSCHEL-related homeobox 11 [Vitis vinifera]|uniref:WUSCHEL-related homeobox 11 n=1 Tax=Vitis vinifera TaxID=29760 RepID=A0A438DHB5_VITVI|nr:WUSCHEL-related homeobox 11 [Vitis vinifera]